MSLRYKILVSVFSVMFIVCALIFLNLYIDSLNKSYLEKKRVSEIIRRQAQQLLFDHIDPTKPFETNAWMGDFVTNFNKSDLFRNWYIVYRDPVYDKFTLLAYSGEVPNLDKVYMNYYVRDAFLAGKYFIDGFTLYTPLVVETKNTDGKQESRTVVAKLNFGHNFEDIQPAFNPIYTLIWILVLGTLLLVFTCYILLERLVIRPIDQLADASKRIAEGNYSQPIPPMLRNDELANLTNTFNLMQKKLQEYTDYLKREVQTAQQKVEETEKHLIFAQRLSAAGTLASGVAHEINNPLAGLINAVRTLKKNNLPEDVKSQYIEIISDGLSRIQDIVNKLLSLTIRKSSPQKINLNDLIQKAISFIQHKIKEKDIKLDVSMPDKIPDLYGEPTEILQVMLNVLLNSVDAVENGRGIIKIYTKDDKDELTIIIEDNGCGMSEEVLSRAFDFFFTTKPPGKGSGLGLSIAYSIVQKYGGKFTIESRENQGTKNCIRFPKNI